MGNHSAIDLHGSQVLEKKARRGCEQRPRRRGSVGMEILLNQLRVFSLRQRGHQQYTRFCRVEGVGHQPGLAVIRRYDAAAGTGGSHHHDARLLRFLIPAALRTDTDPAPVPAYISVGMMGDRRIVHILRIVAGNHK